MAGLLVLGPFLHGHFGTSLETGFHIDGVHAVNTTDHTSLGTMQLGGEESPALGVAASVPQPEDEDVLLFSVSLFTVLVPSLARRNFLFPRGRKRLFVATPLRYRPGLPPPCLAPPIA